MRSPVLFIIIDIIVHSSPLSYLLLMSQKVWLSSAILHSFPPSVGDSSLEPFFVLWVKLLQLFLVINHCVRSFFFFSLGPHELKAVSSGGGLCPLLGGELSPLISRRGKPSQYFILNSGGVILFSFYIYLSCLFQWLNQPSLVPS